MALERDLNKRIVKLVEARGGYILKIHGNMFQPKAVDLVICYKGRFIAVESKLKGNTPTDIQLHTLSRIERAGGTALVAYDADDVAFALDKVDRQEAGNGRQQKGPKARQVPARRGEDITLKSSGTPRPKSTRRSSS